ATIPGEVTEEPLHRVNRHGAVEPGPVADALAGVVAHPAVDRGQRVVGDELPPRLLVVAHFGVRQPGLDVLARRAARGAGGQRGGGEGAGGPARTARARAADRAAASYRRDSSHTSAEFAPAFTIPRPRRR